MASLTAAFIRHSAATSGYVLSLHADDERLNEGLAIEDLEEVLRGAELIEDYPEDPRGPSCLVLGYAKGLPFHVVCGLTRQGVLVVITVYQPMDPKWQDERTRNR